MPIVATGQRKWTGNNTKKKINAGAGLLQKSSKILSEIDQAPILRNQPIQKFPAFRQNEIVLGDLLGKGTVGTVNEITCIRPDGDKASVNTSTSDDIHVDKNKQHKNEIVSRTIRNGRSRYAIKYLRSDLKKSPNTSKAVRARIDLAIEVKYLQAINHPCIIRLRGLPTNNNVMDPNYFFLMDRLEDTLEQRLKVWKAEAKECRSRGFLGMQKKDKDAEQELLQERLIVAYDVATACQYMHSHQLLHRDLKPENIGFDIRGDVKVFDLGLAKSLLPQYHASGGLYKLTACTGSLPYMAPEVAKKEPYNEKCDVFSFGILLWEIMSLKYAFSQYQTRKEMYDKVVVGGIRPPLSNTKSWPRGVTGIIPKCWSPYVKSRPTMDDVCSTMRQSMEGVIENRTEWLAGRSNRSMRTHKAA